MLGDAGTQEAGATGATTDQTTTDATTTETTAPVVPEKYEISLGEGVSLDADVLTAADPILRELGLSNEAANKLAPLAQQVAERTQAGLLQQLQDAGAAQKKEWFDAFVADPEIGGPKREETERLSAKALDALGFVKGHPFRQALTDSGFGNHPDMIRAFRRLGEMVGEDNTFTRPGVGSTDKPVWERMYPNG